MHVPVCECLQLIGSLLCLNSTMQCIVGECLPWNACSPLQWEETHIPDPEWGSSVCFLTCVTPVVSVSLCRSYGHSGICDFVWCRDFDLQLFPDMDLFHPDFTLNTGSQTVQKHSLRSYFYSGFDKSECLHGQFGTFALSLFKVYRLSIFCT